MSDLTFLEAWVCLLRVGTFAPENQPHFAFDESALDSIVAEFRGPMPLDLEFAQLAPPETLPQCHTGSMLIAVEKRSDGRGPYLAGLVRTPHVVVAISMRSIERGTKRLRGPVLTAVTYTNHPLPPIERATDPLTSEFAAPAQTPLHSH